MKRSFFAVLITALLVAGSWAYSQSDDARGGRDRAPYAQFLSSCRMIDGGAFDDPALGFRFRFGNDFVVCDRGETPPLSMREIYILRKDSMERGAPLGQGVVAKVAIDPIPGLPEGIVLGEEPISVAGVSTTARRLQPPSCGSGPCALSIQSVELRHAGKTFLIEEYAPGVGLLESIEFLNTAENL